MSSRRLTLALATIEYPPDPFSAGIGSYTKTLARQLTDRGHKVHVVARGVDESSRTDEDGVTVHRLLPQRPVLPDSLGPIGMVRLLGLGLPGEITYRRNVVRTLHRLVRNEGVQLIECADHLAEPLWYDVSASPHVPFVVRIHTPLAVTEKYAPNIPEPVRLAMRALERRLLMKASHLTAPSKLGADLVLDEMKVDRRVTIYPNPPSYAADVDLQPGPSEDQSPTIDTSPMVLFVGRMNFQKGVHLLIQAMPAIVRAHPEARFVFAGADNISAEGYSSMKGYLLSLLPRSLHDRVTFTGHLQHDELKKYYRAATVCVLPSLFEIFGYTCLEAMTFGKPIVGSRKGGMVELLDEGNAGLLFDPPDVQELQDLVIRLLADGELRRRLGENARRRAGEVYGREQVIAQIEEFYYRVLDERQAKARA